MWCRDGSSPDYIELARTEVFLMREYLALPGDRPHLNDCIEVGTLETAVPPPASSIERLQAWINKYGACHVTTAVSPHPDKITVWVRGDVLEPVDNPLREYLSQD